MLNCLAGKTELNLIIIPISLPLILEMRKFVSKGARVFTLRRCNRGMDLANVSSFDEYGLMIIVKLPAADSILSHTLRF